LLYYCRSVVVEFQVDYNLTEPFIKFESFDVQLFPMSSRDSDIYSITTRFNRVAFVNGTHNNCSLDFLLENSTTINCFDLTPGEYTIRVNIQLKFFLILIVNYKNNLYLNIYFRFNLEIAAAITQNKSLYLFIRRAVGTKLNPSQLLHPS
jgi:hypothetical protein